MSEDQRYGWISWETGHIHLESRFRREGNRLIGEGRARHFDGNVLKQDSGWEPTGCVVTVWDEWPEQPRPWWRFWK